jgi:hydroxymethylpyrimidine pyrophosphatase-like HAD family hydrolase
MSIPQRQIAIDFDGTLMLHEHPFLGNPVPHAVEVVKKLQDAGHTLILLTMRADDELAQAKAWLLDHGLYFDHFNCNPMMETGSRKVYYHWLIDDHSLGVPLIQDLTKHRKPFVDWEGVEKILEEKELI